MATPVDKSLRPLWPTLYIGHLRAILDPLLSAYSSSMGNVMVAPYQPITEIIGMNERDKTK